MSSAAQWKFSANQKMLMAIRAPSDLRSCRAALAEVCPRVASALIVESAFLRADTRPVNASIADTSAPGADLPAAAHQPTWALVVLVFLVVLVVAPMAAVAR